jgi:hypothetical protein
MQYYNYTPFPVSPKVEMYLFHLPPWRKAGKGVDSMVKHYF